MSAAAARVRRLPFVCRPQPDESFASWIERTALELQTPPGVLADALRLPLRRHHTNAVPALFGIAMTPQTAAGLAAASGLPAASFHALHLTRFHGRALDLTGLDPQDERSLHPIARREWVSLNTSRACPECLASDGVWRLSWKLTLSAACPHHGVLLLDHCGTCGAALRSAARGRPRSLTRSRLVDPVSCGATRTGAPPCPALLAAAPTAAVPEPVLTVQKVLLAAAAGQMVTIAGAKLTPARLFAETRALAALVRFAAEPALLGADAPEELTEAFAEHVLVTRGAGGGTSGYTHRPASAAATAAVLTVLASVLTAADFAEQDEALQPLLEAAVTRRRSLGHFPLQGLPLPERVHRALAAPTPHARVATYALGQPRSATPVLPAVAVPGLIGEQDYRLLVAPLLPGTAELTGRRFAALALARLAGARSWRAAEVVTGCPPGTGVRTADVVARRVTDPDRLWQAVRTLERRLASPPWNYADARRALQRVRHVQPEALPPAARGPLAPWTVARRHHAAAWMWAEVAGADWRTSPAMRDPRWPATRDSRHEGYRRFCLRLSATAAQALRAHAFDLCQGAT